MRDEDVLLERVLAGLRDAEPSPGFERRMLTGMDARQPKRAGWWRPALVLACAVFAATFAHNFQQVAVPAMTVAIQAPRPEGPESFPPPSIAEGTRHRQTQQSHPTASPLPLTKQEKLLLRLAHRPDDAAILNPATRAAQAARATAEFQQFFAIDDAEMRTQLE